METFSLLALYSFSVSKPPNPPATSLVIQAASVSGKEAGPSRACSVLVLDFMQERLRNSSPGDFKGTFMKAGVVKRGWGGV